ncbi:MAG: hypothetical protein ACKV19_25355 [Verrucomicrobiales bacterium]
MAPFRGARFWPKVRTRNQRAKAPLQISGAKDGWTKLTNNRVGGKDRFRRLGIVLVLVLE